MTDIHSLAITAMDIVVMDFYISQQEFIILPLHHHFGIHFYHQPKRSMINTKTTDLNMVCPVYGQSNLGKTSCIHGAVINDPSVRITTGTQISTIDFHITHNGCIPASQVEESIVGNNDGLVFGGHNHRTARTATYITDFNPCCIGAAWNK